MKYQYHPITQIKELLGYIDGDIVKPSPESILLLTSKTTTTPPLSTLCARAHLSLMHGISRTSSPEATLHLTALMSQA